MLRGFTLIEILVSGLIFSLIFMAVFMVLSSARETWYTGDVEVELSQEVREALLTMDRQLRQSGATVITGVPANDNYYTSITFRIPEDLDGDGDVINASGGIEWSNNIIYSLNANHQIMRTTQTASSVLANNISSLQFRRPSGNPATIQIYVTAQKATVLGRNLTYTIMSSIKMRN